MIENLIFMVFDERSIYQNRNEGWGGKCFKLGLESFYASLVLPSSQLISSIKL